MPRTGVDDSGFAVHDPRFVVHDPRFAVNDSGFVVNSPQMPFSMIQILRHTLHVVDAAVERTQQVVYMTGVAMDMPPEPTVFCTTYNGMQMVC